MTSGGAFASIILVGIVLSRDKPTLTSIMPPSILLGVSCVSFFPTCLSYGAELTFPLSPALVNACMNFMG